MRRPTRHYGGYAAELGCGLGQGSSIAMFNSSNWASLSYLSGTVRTSHPQRLRTGIGESGMTFRSFSMGALELRLSSSIDHVRSLAAMQGLIANSSRRLFSLRYNVASRGGWVCPSCQSPRIASARTTKSHAPSSRSFSSSLRLGRADDKPYYITTPIFYVNACRS